MQITQNRIDTHKRPADWFTSDVYRQPEGHRFQRDPVRATKQEL